MKRAGLITLLLAVVCVPLAFASGDLSRNDPAEVTVEMGTSGSKMYFKPDHLRFETGKAYKLVFINNDAVKHEFESHEFAEKVFTRKIEVVGADGKMLAEIKGGIREVEVGPGGKVEWFIVPVQTGDNIDFECAIEGHKQAGMVGTMTIF